MKSESFKNSKLALAWVRSQKDARREVQWTSQGCAWRDLEKVVAWVGDDSYTMMPDGKITCDYGYGSARRTRTLCA